MKSWRRFIFYSTTSQLFNAGTNALLVILLARSLSQRGFGVQALALTILPLVLAGFRGVSLEPAVVHGTGKNLPRLVFGDSVRAAILCALGTVLLPIIAGGSVAVGALLALGASLAVLEEAGRWLLARSDRPDLAAIADIAWAVVQVAVLATAGLGSAVVVSASWAAGAGVSVLLAWGAVFTVLRSGSRAGQLDEERSEAPVLHRFRHRRNPGRRNWHWGLEYLAAVSGPQLVLLLAPLGGGVEVAGALSAATSLTGAATVVTGGAQQIAVSRLRLIGSVREMRRWAVIIGVGLGAIVLVCSVPLLFIPTGLGTRLLGQTWAPARAVLPALIVQKTAVAISLGPIFVTRRLPTYRVGLWFRLPVTVAIVAGAVVGAYLDGAQGAALAMAAGAVVSIGIWGGLLARLTRKEGEMDRYFERQTMRVERP
jgi:O-antigen/teichoic acid export membrane protein